jgi:catechol 2,3-dioxygenase-like lactoylglutathione lyase family enzyme
VKFQRRAREVLGLGDGNKVAEMPQFHSRFTLPFRYPEATNIVFHNSGVLGRSSHMKATGQFAAPPKYDTSATRVEMKLEVDVIPVSDVERSKQFYERLGWRFDDDVSPVDGVRIVQFTPPGSACSVTFGKGITAAAPGSAEGGLVVSDIEAAHDDLIDRGIAATNVWHGPPFPLQARQPGPDPKRTSYGSFLSFNDPDGNTWLVQEVTTRAPGRV